jgi:hypothetical protein
MQTKQTESKQNSKGSKFAHAVVVILAIVIGIGALEVGAGMLGRLATAAAEHADVARPDLWAIAKSKMHN